MKDIKIKYHADIPRLKKIDHGDWIDLYSAEDVTINVGEYKLISLGVSRKLPEGYEAHIVPRSSTFKNWGIIQVNHQGVIDNSYCGDNDIWRFPAYCLVGKEDGGDFSHISKGDRICQFRIMRKQPQINFTEVDELIGPNRGGFGSTGL